MANPYEQYQQPKKPVSYSPPKPQAQPVSYNPSRAPNQPPLGSAGVPQQQERDRPRVPNMYDAARANPTQYAANMYGNASRFPQQGSYNMTPAGTPRSSNALNVPSGSGMTPFQKWQQMNNNSAMSSQARNAWAARYQGQANAYNTARGWQAYGDRLTAQAAAYYARPEAKTTQQANDYGYGRGRGYGYGGGGGGGYSRQPEWYMNAGLWRI